MLGESLNESKQGDLEKIYSIAFTESLILFDGPYFFFGQAVEFINEVVDLFVGDFIMAVYQLMRFKEKRDSEDV